MKENTARRPELNQLRAQNQTRYRCCGTGLNTVGETAGVPPGQWPWVAHQGQWLTVPSRRLGRRASQEEWQPWAASLPCSGRGFGNWADTGAAACTCPLLGWQQQTHLGTHTRWPKRAPTLSSVSLAGAPRFTSDTTSRDECSRYPQARTPDPRMKGGARLRNREARL